MLIATTLQMLEAEKMAIEKLGVPSMIIMENASVAVSKHCLPYLQKLHKPKIIVIAGKGVNGGIGLAITRHLFLRNYNISVIFIGNEKDAPHNTRVNLNILKNLNVPVEFIPSSDTLLDIPYSIETCDLVVDAIFGLGVTSEVDGIHEYVIDVVNKFAKYVISVDVPSGLNCANGHIFKTCIRANKTICFGFGKLGLYMTPGKDFTGEVIICDVCIPNFLQESVGMNTHILTDEDAAKILPARNPNANRSLFKKTFVFAGNDEIPGACALTCEAVYVGGGDYVKAYVMRHVAYIVQTKTAEVASRILSDVDGFMSGDSFEEVRSEINDAKVIILGSGLGKNAKTSVFVKKFLSECEVPLIIDGDALSIVAENLDMLKDVKCEIIITPYLPAMSKLTGLTIDEILEDRVACTKAFSKEHGVIVVLKSPITVIAAPNDECYINVSGKNSLVKAGTGEVLTGLIAANISNGANLFESAMLGAYVHGRAADNAELEKSDYSITATDILRHVPNVIKSFKEI